MTDFTDGPKEYLSKKFQNLKSTGLRVDSVLFEECDFKNCDFRESVFTACEFIDCHFSKCDLSVIRLPQCRFTDVFFEDCKAIGIDWTLAGWPTIALFSPLKFLKCKIDDATFFGLSLNEITMEECSAQNVDFREGSFRDANLTYTDLAGSLFKETDLSGADFTEAVNYTIDILHNSIKKAKFSRFEAVSLLEGLDIVLVD